MKINLIKLPIQDILKFFSDQKTALICISDLDKPFFDKLPIYDFNSQWDTHTVLPADIKLRRRYGSHKHLFKMLDFFIDNGGMDKDILIKDEHNHSELGEVAYDTIQKMLFQNQHDKSPKVRTLLDIFEWLYLEPIKKTLPDGTVKEEKGSISYGELEEMDFTLFKNKVKTTICDNLNITDDELNVALQF